jgi:hypothetical protein
VSEYFEIEIMMEDLGKSYADPCGTSWFRVAEQTNPTREQFRNKVVEFMRHFEDSPSTLPNSPLSEKFRVYVRELLEKQIKLILEGHNKEIEKSIS